MRGMRLLGVMLAVSVFAAGCSSPSQTGELKRQIEDVLSSELPNIPVKDVNCGSPDPSLDPGNLFFCTAGVDGGLHFAGHDDGESAAVL